MNQLSSDARNLNWLVSNFVERVPGVQEATVVSSDGLLIALSDGLDRSSGYGEGELFELVRTATPYATLARSDFDNVLAMAADGDLLEPQERSAIEALLATVETVRQGEDHHAIDAAVEALAKGTEAFAAERMNRSIRQGLAGRRVEEV